MRDKVMQRLFGINISERDIRILGKYFTSFISFYFPADTLEKDQQSTEGKGKKTKVLSCTQAHRSGDKLTWKTET